jgi:hypothetical protein
MGGVRQHPGLHLRCVPHVPATRCVCAAQPHCGYSAACTASCELAALFTDSACCCVIPPSSRSPIPLGAFPKPEHLGRRTVNGVNEKAVTWLQETTKGMFNPLLEAVQLSDHQVCVLRVVGGPPCIVLGVVYASLLFGLHAPGGGMVSAPRRVTHPAWTQDYPSDLAARRCVQADYTVFVTSAPMTYICTPGAVCVDGCPACRVVVCVFVALVVPCMRCIVHVNSHPHLPSHITVAINSLTQIILQASYLCQHVITTYHTLTLSHSSHHYLSSPVIQLFSVTLAHTNCTVSQ